MSKGLKASVGSGLHKRKRRTESAGIRGSLSRELLSGWFRGTRLVQALLKGSHSDLWLRDQLGVVS